MPKWTMFAKEEDEREHLVVGENNNETLVARSDKTRRNNGAVLKYTIWNELTARVYESVDEYWYYCKNIKDSCTIGRNKNTGSTAAKSKKNQSFSTRATFLDTFYKRNPTSTVGEIEDELEGYNVPLLKIK